MENAAENIGRFLGALLIAFPAIIFFWRGLGPGIQSRRLANLALFCGLAAFISPEALMRLSPNKHAGVYVGMGIVRVILAVTGIILSIRALTKRADGGVGVARPVVAILFCVVHLFIGAGSIVLGVFNRDGTPWQYH